MGEKKQNNFLKKIYSNIYIKNIFLMIIVAIIILWAILFFLNKYTRHNESVNVPEVKGLLIGGAESILRDSDLKYEVVDSIYQKEGIPGTILEQIPHQQANVKKGRTIYLIVQAKNEPAISVPDLQYASLRQAEALLKALGFAKPEIKYQRSEFQDLVLGVELKNKTVSLGQKLPKSTVLTIIVGDGYGSDLSDDSVDTDSISTEETFEENLDD